MLTPYQFASNTPIQAVDIDGLEAANALFRMKEMLMGVEKLRMNTAINLVDVQRQQYRLIVKNPDKSVSDLFNTIVSDVGTIYNTDYGTFSFKKQQRENNLTENDILQIDPSMPLLFDIFVKVVDVETMTNENGDIDGFSFQFRTLEGHVEVGAITFTGKMMMDEDSGESYLHFMIESTSQVDPMIAQILSIGSDFVREDQIDNWNQTFGNILKYVGGEKEQADVLIETYGNSSGDFEIERNNPNSIGKPTGTPNTIEHKDLSADPASNN